MDVLGDRFVCRLVMQGGVAGGVGNLRYSLVILSGSSTLLLISVEIASSSSPSAFGSGNVLRRLPSNIPADFGRIFVKHSQSHSNPSRLWIRVTHIAVAGRWTRDGMDDDDGADNDGRKRPSA